MSVAVQPRRWRLVVLTALLPVVMALAAFVAMPRLYSLWCTITGTGMNPNNAAVAAAAESSTGRYVEAFFEAKVFDGLPVEFTCEQPSVQVEVGREGSNVYRLRNTSAGTLHIRPIHQVSPTSATPHFGMRICFCFNDQILAPGEVKEFPVSFTFSPDLDPRTTTVSVCYSLFRIDPGAARSEEQLRIQRQVESQGGVVSPGFRILDEADIERLRRSEGKGVQ